MILKGELEYQNSINSYVRANKVILAGDLNRKHPSRTFQVITPPKRVTGVLVMFVYRNMQICPLLEVKIYLIQTTFR
jgi:hypothetical protein